MDSDDQEQSSLAERVGDDPLGDRELTLAARRFRTKARGDQRLLRLLLIDPLRVYDELGINVSRKARKRMRRLHPELPFDRGDAYERAQRGESLPWVRRIDIGRGEEAEGEV